MPLPEFVDKTSYVAPSNELESQLCAIWEEVLGLERVGITDDFFRIGGNSILAMQVAHRVSQSLEIHVSVVDFFSYKTIQQLVMMQHLQLGRVNPGGQILKPLAGNAVKPKMFFIHPGAAGCEVYQTLAGELKKYYSCIGIDNYNIHFKNKIASLSTLAKTYLEFIENNIELVVPIRLCGWSLGGMVALEIAYILEQRGFKSIQIYLFDTHILTTDVKKLCITADELKFPDKKNITNLPFNKFNPYSKRNLFSVSKAEANISQQDLSGILTCTNITLFKATQLNQNSENNLSDNIRNCLLRVKDNNIQSFAVKPIIIHELSCSHEDILSFIVKNWADYEKYLT